MISEVVELEGHIIDSNILTKVLDDIYSFGAEFTILEFHVGQSRNERSHARIEVRAENAETMQQLLASMSRHGALWEQSEEAEIVAADMDGAFPDDFYCTTNQETSIWHKGHWVRVLEQEMDCGIRFDPARQEFRCVPMIHVRRGDGIVCGERGVRVKPFERQHAKGVFEFMGSEISTEKPKNMIIRQCAQLMRQAQIEGKKLLLVGGPAIVHTGAAVHVVRLIERGYLHVLFAGNALAAHDIELNLYGTSLGVYLDKPTLAETGHQHHLRTINTIRRAGGIAAAVESGILSGGIMHACVRHKVDFVLAGSVRDDGPLPDVITDVLQAQDRMRAAIREVGFALMVATALHSIATGNILPAWIPAVCVDISPMILTKIADRGSFQTIGLVTDVEPFFRELLSELDALEAISKSEPACPHAG